MLASSKYANTHRRLVSSTGHFANSHPILGPVDFCTLSKPRRRSRSTGALQDTCGRGTAASAKLHFLRGLDLCGMDLPNLCRRPGIKVGLVPPRPSNGG
jgi:hypothetical protein